MAENLSFSCQRYTIPISIQGEASQGLAQACKNKRNRGSSILLKKLEGKNDSIRGSYGSSKNNCGGPTESLCQS